jgi:hypothetical protein
MNGMQIELNLLMYTEFLLEPSTSLPKCLKATLYRLLLTTEYDNKFFLTNSHSDSVTDWIVWFLRRPNC